MPPLDGLIKPFFNKLQYSLLYPFLDLFINIKYVNENN